MVDEFIQYIQKQPLTIWISFKGSADFIKNDHSHLEIAKSKDINGYDLKWLVKRCSYILSPVNKKRIVNN